MANCPRMPCLQSPNLRLIVGKGSYFRSSDSRYISRFFCRKCGRSFSFSTNQPCFGQKKRRVNEPLRRLITSGVSQRRAAILLNVHRTTVARKFRFLALRARKLTYQYLSKRYPKHHVKWFQFDEMESSVRTKWQPVSIALAVDEMDRKILGFSVSSMPARGVLAKKAREKYGFRPDERAKGMAHL